MSSSSSSWQQTASEQGPQRSTAESFASRKAEERQLSHEASFSSSEEDDDNDGANQEPAPEPQGEEKDTVDTSYEGPRLRKLRDALDKALTSCRSTAIKPEKFGKAFPELMDKYHELIEQLSTTLMDRLNYNIKSEFEKICEERELVYKLNKLDQDLHLEHVLSGETDGKKRVAPDPDSVSNRAGDAVVRQRDAELETLEHVYKQLCNDNEELEGEVEQLDRKAKRVYEELRSTVDSLDLVAQTAEGVKSTSSSRR